jgi:hypothetical protein
MKRANVHIIRTNPQDHITNVFFVTSKDLGVRVWTGARSIIYHLTTKYLYSISGEMYSLNHAGKLQQKMYTPIWRTYICTYLSERGMKASCFISNFSPPSFFRTLHLTTRYKLEDCDLSSFEDHIRIGLTFNNRILPLKKIDQKTICGHLSLIKINLKRKNMYNIQKMASWCITAIATKLQFRKRQWKKYANWAKKF